ncbi:hypothetical protein NHX12_031424 [Muraenolepis orangiensis]|uniref:Actin interacting protein 3-like C-terminal domain-containing protein n=1 Tax=Muraenolepis orangiensis TaxID=630683 RepID=A0A9Q0E594_9TELE|nr:hypothetical protein NHX12_031424 [Muraenolepis orangiensis]
MAETGRQQLGKHRPSCCSSHPGEGSRSLGPGQQENPSALSSSISHPSYSDSVLSPRGRAAEFSSAQSRSPRHSQSTQSGLADQAAKLSFASAESLETMSEADMPTGFNRMNRFRQSLPLSRSASQSKLRSPGVLFLQYGDETRRVHITHELSSLDTLHALIVHMFPQKLTAGMLKSPNTAILIKDEARNVFYELEDIRDIQDRSVIKIYRKEPIYASGRCAILERRDVKPDEEASGKSLMLLKSEGLYADPYSLVHEGRLSIASTQSLAAIGDPFGFPVTSGLYRRGSVRSLSTYSAAGLQGDLEDSLYKPGGGGGYSSDTYSSATLGMSFRMPPSSPQKIPEMQLRGDRDPYSPSRASPVRQTFRKDSASSSDSDSNTRDQRLERMEAMEKQIASLTGLVQSVLTRAPDSDSTCGLLRLCMMAGCPPDQGAEFSRPLPFSSSDKTETNSDGSATGTGRLKQKAGVPAAPRLSETRVSRAGRRGLQNQDSVKTLLKRTEAELSVRVADALRKQEDPLQRQRLLVEEERLKYLNEEELIIQQLHDMERSVEELQKEASVSHKLAPVPELEEKAALLRRLGETLTDLKTVGWLTGGESASNCAASHIVAFKRCNVNRYHQDITATGLFIIKVYFKAVKFLKEEPHRLDALLKRCKTMTDTLATMRRQASDGVWKKQDDFSGPSAKRSEDFRKGHADFEVPPPLILSDLSGGLGSSMGGGLGSSMGGGLGSSMGGGLGSSMGGGLGSSMGGGLGSSMGGGLGSSMGGGLGGGVNSLANWSLHSSHSHGYGVPAGASHGHAHHPPVPHKGRALEELERRTSACAQDINRLLEETQAELMKAIPDLDFAAKQIKPSTASSSSTSGSTPSPQPASSGTQEHRVSKPQHGKLPGKEPGSRRGSDELTKTESEESEGQKPHVKLRRAASESQRPASTPPSLASGDREETEEDKIAAELELFERAPVRLLRPRPLSLSLHPPAGSPPDVPPPSSSLNLPWPPGAPDTMGMCPSPAPLPQIVLTECLSASSSPPPEAPVRDVTGAQEHAGRGGFPGWTGVSGVPSSSPLRWEPLDPRALEGDGERREDLVLVLSEPEVRVVSPVEAHGLSRSRPDGMQMLVLPPPPHAGRPSGETLRDRPALVLFRVKVTVREAYWLLYSHLAGATPGSGSSSCSLPGALRRGMETGDRVLKLQPASGPEKPPRAFAHNTHPESSSPDGPGGSGKSPRGSKGEDVRHSTFRRLDSLEETIRELENTLLELSGQPPSRPGEPCRESHGGGGGTTTTSPPTGRPPVPPKPSVLTPPAPTQVPLAPETAVEPHPPGPLAGSSPEGPPYGGVVLLPEPKRGPQGPTLSQLTATSSQARALLASLSASGLSSSGLSAEALLLSSALRLHHRLLREKAAIVSSATSSSPSSSSSSTSTLPSTSPSSSSSSTPSSPPSLFSLGVEESSHQGGAEETAPLQEGGGCEAWMKIRRMQV